MSTSDTPTRTSRRDRADGQASHGAAIEVSDVVKTFRTGTPAEIRAVDGVSLAIAPSEVVALTGPSGSGKSTLLHLIGAIDTADSGTITVGDDKVTALAKGDLAAYRRRVGFVFQRYHLLPALSVIDNVLAPVLPIRTGFDRRERAHSLLDLVGLTGRDKDLPGELSGGQQQRVAIARALINDPPLLLADEPTGNLDTRTGAEIIDLLLRLRAERGTTLAIATHDLTLASRCDRVVRLRDGKILDEHRPSEPARHAIKADIDRLG